MSVQLQQNLQKQQDVIGSVFDDWVLSGKAQGMERRHKRLAELMLEHIEISSSGRVLDIGCGDGWLLRLLSGRLTEGALVGIDLSMEMVRIARSASEEFDNILYAPAPAEQVPWANDYFTHVLSIESAYYWASPALAIKDIYRVTSCGGSFHILINYYAENEYSASWDQEVGLPLHRLSASQWVELFKSCNFENVKSERIQDDSPIPENKQSAERRQREGLQREGALYLHGNKPALSAATRIETESNPFRVLR